MKPQDYIGKKATYFEYGTQIFRKKETVDKKVFKVNLGDGIEILTCEELRYRFDNLTKKEQDYLNKNARKCTNITEINSEILTLK